MTVDLIWLGIDTQSIDWPLGQVYSCAANPEAVSTLIELGLPASNASAWLFWDSVLGAPDPARVQEMLASAADAWHAGLRMGTSGLPEDIDYITPDWTLNRDPDPGVRAISWRMSLRVCLLRRRVLEALGHIDPVFETLEAAGLDMGYRYIKRGAVMLNEPGLVEGKRLPASAAPSLQDSYTFIARHFKPVWLKYMLTRRALASGRLFSELRAYRSAMKLTAQTKPPYRPDGVLQRPAKASKSQAPYKVSVLIPTIYRYPYLQDTLEQLNRQTRKPFEVICVDQTPQPDRQPGLYESFSGLNLKVFWLDEPGQCSARNLGLSQIRGDLVLFLDDDVIIEADFIQALVDGLELYDADISGCVWSQGQQQAIAPADRNFRVSDRLTTSGTIVRPVALEKSGGFDLNYDRNYRADADLGMRLYLSGATSIITPNARENSLSAPTGGLKTYGAFDGTRRIGLLQPWPAATQTYYWRRYFSSRQCREALILTFLSAAVPRELRYSASFLRKLAFVAAALWTLPFRLLGAWKSLRLSREMLTGGPQIPAFEYNPENQASPGSHDRD